MWIIYALLSAVFAALTTILAKIGVENVDSTLATAIRTAVVLVRAWGTTAGRIEVASVLSEPLWCSGWHGAWSSCWENRAA